MEQFMFFDLLLYDVAFVCFKHTKCVVYNRIEYSFIHILSTLTAKQSIEFISLLLLEDLVATIASIFLPFPCRQPLMCTGSGSSES